MEGQACLHFWGSARAGAELPLDNPDIGLPTLVIAFGQNGLCFLTATRPEVPGFLELANDCADAKAN